MSATPETRKYLARHYVDGKITRERVIEATNRSTARAYASNSTISIELLTADDAMRLGAAGVVTEDAGRNVAPDTSVDPNQQELPVDTVVQA